MAQRPPPHPFLVRSVSQYASLLSHSRQLSRAGLLSGLAGIREAYTMPAFVLASRGRCSNPEAAPDGLERAAKMEKPEGRPTTWRPREDWAEVRSGLESFGDGGVLQEVGRKS